MSVTKLASALFLLGFVTCTNKLHFCLSWHFASPNNFTFVFLDILQLASSPCSPTGRFYRLVFLIQIVSYSSVLQAVAYSTISMKLAVKQWFLSNFTLKFVQSYSLYVGCIVSITIKYIVVKIYLSRTYVIKINSSRTYFMIFQHKREQPSNNADY